VYVDSEESEVPYTMHVDARIPLTLHPVPTRTRATSEFVPVAHDKARLGPHKLNADVKTAQTRRIPCQMKVEAGMTASNPPRSACRCRQ